MIGTDLSPIQPSWVPPNLKFVIDDAEDDWVGSSEFDFIHLRTLSGSIKDIPRLLQQAYQNIAPGGWIEWQEYEGKLKSDDDSLQGSKIMEWQDYTNEAAEKASRALDIAPTLKPEMEKAGFASVQDKEYKVRFKFTFQP